MYYSDAHNDVLTSLDDNALDDYFNSVCRDKVKILNCAIFTTTHHLGLKKIEEFVVRLKRNRPYRKHLIFSIEDVSTLSIDEIKILVKLRPVSCTLTWNDDNLYAGGALGKIGITKKGREIIHILEENNVFVDTAHLNKKSFWTFSRVTKKPIYNSHSNLSALKRHKRNLSDKQIEQIVKTNGFLGITIYQKFIAESRINARDVANQFDYLIKHFGYKNFGLGTDFFGIDDEFLPQDIQRYKDLKNIVNELKRLGYSNNVIRHLMYKNYLRFLKENALLD